MTYRCSRGASWLATHNPYIHSSQSEYSCSTKIISNVKNIIILVGATQLGKRSNADVDTTDTEVSSTCSQSDHDAASAPSPSSPKKAKQQANSSSSQRSTFDPKWVKEFPWIVLSADGKGMVTITALQCQTII